MQARRMILKAAIAMGLGVAMVSGSALIGSGSAHAQEKTVRIGFQKYGKLVLLKSKGSLETRLKALGWNIKWTEFSAGPALLEACLLYTSPSPRDS